jgi:hypothetical protein
MPHCPYCGHEHDGITPVCGYCRYQSFDAMRPHSRALSAVAHALEQRVVTRILSALVDAGVIAKENAEK